MKQLLIIDPVLHELTLPCKTYSKATDRRTRIRDAGRRPGQEGMAKEQGQGDRGKGTGAKGQNNKN